MATPKLKLVIKDQVPIREIVYRHIRDEILNGRIPPLQRLVEGDVAAQIGTSRTPVREAFHILEKEGLLEVIPRVGYRVTELNWDELVETCELRVFSETLAATWAIERITPEEVQALEENIAVSEARTRAGNPRAFVEGDAQFHEILVKASRSRRLIDFCEVLRRHMLRYRIKVLRLEETALRAIEEHRRILESLTAEDKEGVAHAIRYHIEMVKQSIQQNAFTG